MAPQKKLCVFFASLRPFGYAQGMLCVRGCLFGCGLFALGLNCKNSLSTSSRTIIPGSFSQAISHDGLQRSYRLYIPPTFDGNNPSALLIGLHGGRVTGESMELLTKNGFNNLADQDGFAVVYPDAYEMNWNDGREVAIYPSHTQNIDDVGFISNLIDTLIADLNIDPGRVYVTGASNGALMSHRLACELSDKIAAIAPVMGAIPEKIVSTCSPTRPISVLAMNGTEDPTVPWEGGNVKFVRDVLGTVESVPGTIEHWVAHNGCSTTPIITMEPDTDPGDSTTVRRESYNQCRDDSEVIL
ncbi:MAG: alpha/beta hydrolase family esterase, partial [bacterium]